MTTKRRRGVTMREARISITRQPFKCQQNEHSRLFVFFRSFYLRFECFCCLFCATLVFPLLLRYLSFDTTPLKLAQEVPPDIVANPTKLIKCVESPHCRLCTICNSRHEVMVFYSVSQLHCQLIPSNVRVRCSVALCKFCGLTVSLRR